MFIKFINTVIDKEGGTFFNMEYLDNKYIKIPQLGFGTAGIGNDEKTVEIIKLALKVGFRRFDTASMYENENAVGRAIAESKISREELFVTTKLWDGGNFSYQNTIKACQKSLEQLDLEYLDLYLHHWPVQDQRLDSWLAMEELMDIGLVKAIGVSNYTVKHLKEILDHSNIAPSLNQVEFNPFLYQKELLEFCKTNDIILEAYSPFSKGKRLKNEILVEIADNHNRSTAQIILRWGIQLGISVIPKASTPKHIHQNYSIFNFELSEEEMSMISDLNENYRIEWDPTNIP